jgi:multicomponent Na+:H+ antiporter subunit D
MIMGLAIFTPLGIAGAIFFALHNMLAKTNTFVVAGLINRMRGSYSLRQVGGLFRDSPILAVLFIIPAFALAGIPPLSGFYAKFILIKAGFEDGHYWITGIAILTGLLTLYSMIKIWNEAFLKKAPESVSDKKITKLTFLDLLPSIILGSATIFMGIFAASMFSFTREAAEALLNPMDYLQHIITR